MKSKLKGAVAVVVIVVLGFVASTILTSMKEPPAPAEPKELALRVQAIEVQPQTVPVVMTGYGQTRSLNVVTISPEISGRVVNINPNLKVGGIIPAGEIMFEIDPSTYQAQLNDASASVEMSRQTIERLNRQYAADQERLKTFERSRDLARAEFERVRELYEKDEVGTRSAVEQAERAFNQAADQVDQLTQALEVYPVQIKEAQSALEAAQARKDLAEINMQRTVVKAPFDARVQAVTLEANQYVAPGASVLTLADDSVLEISVPLDSREARNWLRFKEQDNNRADAWFRELEPVPVEIRWTEEPDDHVWEGTQHRVEKFDEQTRTVTVAVRISGEQARSRGQDGLPLVQGMFCQVRIPGRQLSDAYRIPSEAVSFDGIAYKVVDGRLKTVKLTRALNMGEEAIITDGLNPGDVVITTRLVNPLENSIVEVAQPQSAAAAAPASHGGSVAQ